MSETKLIALREDVDIISLLDEIEKF